MKKELHKAYIALALVSFFWGTTYIAARIGAHYMPGLFLAGVRQFLSGLLLAGFFVLRGYKLPPWVEMKKIFFQGLLLLCIANGLLTWSLEYISGGLAAIIAALGPLFITLFSMMLSRSAKITPWLIVGILIGFAGVFVIFYDYPGEVHNRFFPFGLMMALIATLSWAYGSVYSSRQKLSTDILFNVGLQMFGAGIVMLLVCFLTGKTANLALTASSGIYAMAYLVVFGSLLAYSAYVYAISKLPPTLVSIYAYINPVVAIGFGWMLLHEKLNASMLVGAAITLAGVWLVKRASQINTATVIEKPVVKTADLIKK
jgi:drug/metabolite transporter (DMT)-like permease